MGTLTRLILVCAMLLQPLVGLAQPACPRVQGAAAMGARKGAACPCCAGMDGGSDDAAACPMAVREAAGCDCIAVPMQDPTTLPDESKVLRVAQLLAVMPALGLVLPPQGATVSVRWRVGADRGWRCDVRVQSLLCVWLN